jgi:NADH dehydrogenase
VPHPRGGTCPSVGIYALKHGGQIATNLRLTLSGRAPEPFRYPGLGQGVSIGKRTAVGEVKGIPVRGLPAWIVWRALLFYYFPTWDRRLRLLADWSIWPIVGRDIVEMGRAHSVGDYDVRHHVYQPGQVIAESSRPVRHVHVIVEGEVELVRRNGDVDDGDTLGPGDHFGRKWLETAGADAARAKTLVRTVALRADQANRLQDVLLSTGRLVARTAAHDLDALRRGEGD